MCNNLMSKWEMVRLGDVCEIVSGTTPSTQRPELWDGGVKWVTPAEISDDSYFIYDTERHISEKAGLKPMPAGTVLLSSRAPIGKIAIAAESMCCNQGFKNLVCSNNIHNRYLYRYLKNQTVYLNSLGRGATFKEISKPIVENIYIPLPPLPVQQKIADVLDSANTLVERRKAQIEKLDLLVKSQFIVMFGDPVTNPMGWEVKKLDDVYEIIDGDRGDNYPKHEDFSESGHCLFLNAGNVTKRGFNFTNRQFVSEIKDNALRKGKLQRYDIVLTTRGTVGNLAYYNDSVPYLQIRINSGMVILRKRIEIVAEYFLEFFSNPQLYLRLMSGTAQPQMPISSMRMANIIVPPLALQTQFAAFVERVEAHKAKMKQGLALLELEYKSLMQKCFNGELLCVS